MKFDIVEMLKVFNRDGVANDAFILTVFKRNANRYLIVYGNFDGTALNTERQMPSDTHVHISHAFKYDMAETEKRFPNDQPCPELFTTLTKQKPLNVIQFNPEYSISLEELAHFAGVPFGSLHRNTFCYLDISPNDESVNEDLLLSTVVEDFKDCPFAYDINEL